MKPSDGVCAESRVLLSMSNEEEKTRYAPESAQGLVISVNLRRKGWAMTDRLPDDVDGYFGVVHLYLDDLRGPRSNRRLPASRDDA